MEQGKNQAYHEAKSLLKKANEAERRSTSDALTFSEDALLLSKKHGFENLTAQAHMRIGRCYWITGAFDRAITHLSEAVEMATKLEDYETKAEGLIGLGNVYITMEFTDPALDYYTSALEIAETYKLEEQQSKLFNNLGSLHEELQNYKTALKFYQLSYEKALSNKDDYAVAIAHLNIGNVYLSLNDQDKAIDGFMKACEHAKQNDRHLLLAHTYYSLGQYYEKLNKHYRSIQELQKGILSAEESKDIYILVRIYLELGKAYRSANNVPSAREYYEKAFELAKKMKSIEFMPKIHKELASFYEENELFEKSFEHYKAYFNVSEQIAENRRKERIKNIEFQTQLQDAVKETNTYRKLTNQLEKNVKQMKVLSSIGRSMTATHNVDPIFKTLYDSINDLMTADTLAIGFHNQESNTIDVDFLIENHQQQNAFSLSLDNEKSLTVVSFLNKRTIQMNDVEKEHKGIIKNISATRGNLMLSAMYAPIIFDGEAIGVFSIQAKHKNAYSETDILLLETLASYLAIAIKNAKHMKSLANLNQRLKTLSESDGLTGIPNRRLFNTTFDLMWNQSLETQKPFSTLFIDIDDFKAFNDKHGHLIGDEVLVRVAHFLQEYKEEKYFVSRYGGDEFIMLLPNTSIDIATKYAKKLQVALSGLKHGKGINQSLKVSIGLATVTPTESMKQETFLKFVDEQLYASKDQGKNSVTSNTYKA